MSATEAIFTARTCECFKQSQALYKSLYSAAALKKSSRIWLSSDRILTSGRTLTLTSGCPRQHLVTRDNGGAVRMQCLTTRQSPGLLPRLSEVYSSLLLKHPQKKAPNLASYGRFSRRLHERIFTPIVITAGRSTIIPPQRWGTQTSNTVVISPFTNFPTYPPATSNLDYR